MLSSCDNIFKPIRDLENQIIVIGGNGNVLSFYDYNTLINIRNDTLEVPDSLHLYGACLSTNKDYMICAAHDKEPNFTSHFVIYNIKKGEIEKIFSAGLNGAGNVKLCSGNIESEPGIFYYFSPQIGLYMIDFENEIITVKDPDYYRSTDLYVSSDNEWIVVSKYLHFYPNETEDYHRLEFFLVNDHLQSSEFILNENNEDNINIKDIAFSDLNDKLYISYLESGNETDSLNAYFGSYDLLTGELDSSNIALPFPNYTISDYFKNCLIYNSQKNECYIAGYTDKFYIIGLDSSAYYIKNEITIPERVADISDLAITPDGEKAFLSNYYQHNIYVIDLENRDLSTALWINEPLKMFITY